MSVRRAAAFVLALALALLPAAGRASGGRAFRLISMDFKQSLADAESYAAYRAHLAERIETASTVFASVRPNLVVLPEDTGLTAWLVGPRGAHARSLGTATGNSSVAIAALAATYAPQVAYYAAKCPGIPPARALVLALSDTTWRAFGEPLLSLAAEHDAWISANANIPAIAVTRDPARVALLGDPAIADKTYAYEGGCEVFNTAVVFPPSARLDSDGAADPAPLPLQRKAYLVPIERTQDVGLAMTGESMSNVRPIVTPFARLGILTSKDAWMPDATERLDDLGMDVFLQPEAGAWAGYAGDEAGWPPDAMQRAIWAQVQRLPGARYGALADLTGNLFDLYFDGTATITSDASPSDAPACLLGRRPGPGFVARAPWVVADACPVSDIGTYRDALSAAGATVAGANAQREGFVYTDVTLPPLGPFGARVGPVATGSCAIAPSPGAQWTPSVSAASSTEWWVTWTDLRAGNERPAAMAVHGGCTPVSGTWFAGTSPRPNDQQGNGYDARSVALADGSLATIWTDFRNQGWSIWGARATAAASFGAQRLVDHSPSSALSSAEGYPVENIHQDPAIACDADGSLYAAWADLRGTRAHAKIAVARSTDGGASWKAEVRADGAGPLETTPEQLRALDAAGTGDEFAPAIAVAPDHTVWVAWQDHTSATPQIMVSHGDGVSFGAPVPADAAPYPQYRPSLAVDASGHVAVAWEDARSGSRAIRVSVDGTPSLPAAEPPAGTTQQRVALAAVPGGFAIAFQDDRGGDQDVLLTYYARATHSLTPPGRVDGGPDGADARLPAINALNDVVAITWEDARSTVEQIRAVWLRAPAL